METVTIEQDIKVFYVTAKSYPQGIIKAHNSLHTLVPFSAERKYFGLSRPENNSGIVYKAATEEMYAGEAEKYSCDTLVIKKGKYICTTVTNFREDATAIEKAFKTLLSQTGLDAQGYCVEWYLNDEASVKCMIRLQE